MICTGRKAETVIVPDIPFTVLAKRTIYFSPNTRARMPRKSEQFYTELGSEGLSKLKTKERTDDEISYIKNVLKKEWHILDLGCGYGRIAIPLAQNGYDIDGMDITPEMITSAIKNSRKAGLEMEFVVGDMRKLPFLDESYDAVICMWNTFSEITETSDQIAAVKEISRILRSGGSAIIEVRNHRKSGIDWRYSIGGVEGMPSYGHTKRSLKNLMTSSGITKFNVFTDKFGGRIRLFLRFWKEDFTPTIGHSK